MCLYCCLSSIAKHIGTQLNTGTRGRCSSVTITRECVQYANQTCVQFYDVRYAVYVSRIGTHKLAVSGYTMGHTGVVNVAVKVVSVCWKVGFESSIDLPSKNRFHSYRNIEIVFANTLNTNLGNLPFALNYTICRRPKHFYNNILFVFCTMILL